MAKTTAPLLSFGARGQIGKTMVASTWRGVKYMRQHVIPTNPKTTAQMGVRNTFAMLREAWKLAPAQVVNAWNAFAQGRPFTGMNKWVGENIRALNGQIDLNNIIMSPGAKGGLPPIGFSAATGVVAGTIDVTFIYPDEPDGWTLIGASAAALPDAAPDAFFNGPFRAVSIVAPATTGTISDLGSAIPCQVGGWLLWEKPNGETAYSVSIVDQATSDA